MGRLETILQFGGGRFLRGFFDLFVHQAHEGGQDVGKIVIVQSSESSRADAFKIQNGKYHVLIRGIENGLTLDASILVTSISRAISAKSEWQSVLEIATSPDLQFVVSNTTEKGYELKEHDAATDMPPDSFPAKLLLVLKSRFLAGLGGLTLLPCELIEKNAEAFQKQVLRQAERWNESAELVHWIRKSCVWRSTLVDRIVTEKPERHALSETDALLTVAEPFAFWAIEQTPGMRPLFVHPAIHLVPDVTPYLLRKVRILNGAHTALVSKAMPMGFKTVQEAIANPEIESWLRRLLFEEIVPTMGDQALNTELFAEQTLERFANPFLNHKLADIALYDETKRQIRLVPTLHEFTQKFGHAPPLLSEVLEKPLALVTADLTCKKV